MTSDSLFVRSHTARDLLQSAGLFKTDRAVVWEYVSNGLQYVDPGVNPVVRVTLDSKKRRIVIEDAGRGMDWSGLENFFVMHGENIVLKQGKPGRGLFGTGKSAAFGIADLLRVTSVRNGRQSAVELSRRDIESMQSGDPIPVRVLSREAPTDQPNGTIVEIEGIHLRSLDQAGVIQYIERHLSHWSRNATVFVNNHECEFAEPPVSETKLFRPEGTLKERLGDIQIMVKISKSPLEEDFRGISIFSNGVWYATTLAGSEGREMTQYIFGEIDVPRLDEDRSPIAPVDMSRSMKLNPNNELVQAIYAFVGQKVEEVRRELVEREKLRRESAEAKKLSEQAAAIANVINEDFEAFRLRVAKAKAKGAGAVDPQMQEGGKTGSSTVYTSGADLPGRIVSETGAPGVERQNGGGGGGKRRTLGPLGEVDPLETERRLRPTSVGHVPKPKGGFLVAFKNMGQESYRAHYVRDERTIYINLDHPQLSAAKGAGSIEDPIFRRLAYEVAFSEYAVALASELALQDEYVDPTDPIVDIRETINRIARRAANLYSSSV